MGGRNRKVVDLSHEDDSFALNQYGVEAWLMGRRGQPKFAKNGVGVFLPEPGGFRVALHCGENRDHMSWRDGGFLQVLFPPFVECPVGTNEESLFGGGGLAKELQTLDPKMSRFLAAEMA